MNEDAHAASEGHWQLWAYVSARTSLQCRFKKSKSTSESSESSASKSRRQYSLRVHLHHDVTLRPAIEREMLCSLAGSALARHLDTAISLLGTAGRAGPRRCTVWPGGGQDPGPGARLCIGRSESESLPLEESLAREE